MTDKPEHSSLKWKSIALVLMMVCASVLGTAYAIGSGTGGNSIPVVIESGSGVETASYIIYKDGDYTCLKNGTTGRIELRNENSSKVIQSAIDAGPGTIFITSGDYQIDYPIKPASDIHLTGDGNLILPESSQFLLTNSYDVFDSFTISNDTPTIDVLEGNKNISIADASGYSVGDLVRITSKNALTIAGLTYTTGEMNVVSSINGNTITLATPVKFDYNIGDNAEIGKVGEVLRNFTLSHLNLIGYEDRTTANETVCVRIYYSINTNIYGLHINGFGYNGISISNSFMASVDNCYVENIQNAGYGYGAYFAATSHGTISNCVFFQCRRGTDGTGVDHSGDGRYVWSTGIIYSGNHYIDTDGERTHVPIKDYVYDNCIFDGVKTVQLFGPDGVISNSMIINPPKFDWRGTAANEILYLWENNSAYNVIVRGTNQTQQDGVKAYGNNTIMGLDVSGINYNGIRLYGDNIKISDSKVSIDHGHNIYSTLAGINNIIISNCEITTINSHVSTDYVIMLSTATDVVIQNCAIKTVNLGRGLLLNEAFVIGCIIDVYSSNYVLTTGSNSVIKDNIINGVIKTTSSSFVSIIGNTFSPGRYFADYVPIDLITAKNVMVSDNQFNFATANYYIRVKTNCENITVDGNQKLTVNKPIVYADSGLRIVIDGVGTNGANDPASAGEWFGYAYEGLFVKWNNGATHYLSVYRSAAWYDWVVA